ncbi:MAG: AbrB/MazE/SpoVT family DNA-binding domain-containing protein [Thermofilaceae archaeon]
MPIVKVTRSYQVTLPAEVRRELGIRVGDLLRVTVAEGRIVIEKVEKDLPAFELERFVAEKDIEEAIRRGLLRQLGVLDGSNSRQ